MGQHQSLIAWSVMGLQAVTGYLAGRNFRKIASLSDFTAISREWTGHVSIVVPSRNEAEKLPDLLRSLSALRGVDADVMVVDDASTDGTAEVAARFGARVLRVPGPPAGWTGKTFACQTGASVTDGEWILFTDADTVHRPNSLRRALSAAAQLEAGLLSLLPRQRCETVWGRLLLPYAYALYFVGAFRVNRRFGPAIANGQYLLVRRSDYTRLGGHAAVRGSIVEDVALAKLARRNGVQVALLRAQDDVVVRMYAGLSLIWEGFSKNSFRFLQASPFSGLLTVLATISISASVPAALSGGPVARRAALMLVPALSLAGWMRRFDVPLRYALLHPVAAAVFQLLALDSIRRALTPGHTVWKGRRY